MAQSFRSPCSGPFNNIVNDINRGLTSGDINYSKGLKAIDVFCNLIMTASFETHFVGGAQPIADWLSATGQIWKKHFTRKQQDIIESQTEFKDMDITLQYKILTLWCSFRPVQDPCWQNDADSEENSLYLIKEQRNKFAHESRQIKETVVNEAERNRLFDELTSVCHNALDKLKNYKKRLGLPIEDIEYLTDHVERGLNTLKRQDVVVELEETENKLIKDGAMESEPRKRDLLEIQPFPQILRFRPFLLKDIYEPLDLHVERRGLRPGDSKNVPLPVRELLTTPESGSSSSRPHVICVEGPSGAGKSIFVAQVVFDHLDAIKSIDELESFQLVLYLPCKQTCCGTTLKEFIRSSLPNTSKNVSDDLLLRAVRNLKVLVIADGFDEVSQQVRCLLSELYQEAQHGSLCILLTTRTGSLDEAVSLMRGIKCFHVLLSALPPAKIEIMAGKYYKALQVRMSSPPPEEEVVKAVSIAAKHIERTPRNIILLTYFACVQPEKVKAPLTLPELLNALDQMYLKMLMERLADQGLTRSDTLKEINFFIKALNAAALQSILKGEVDIEQECLQQLADECSYPNDMLDAFLSCRRHQTIMGDTVVYTFPHTSQLEYRAALGIRDQLKEYKLDKGKSDQVLHDILQIGQGKKVELHNLWNLLLILVGVLKLDGLLSSYAKEMAELVVSSRSSVDAALEAIAQSDMQELFSTSVTSKLRRDRWNVKSNIHVLKSLCYLPRQIILQVQNCCNDEPYLAEVIESLRERSIEVMLTLNGCLHYMCSKGCCTWPITKLTAPGGTCTVRQLQGPWDVNIILPTSLWDLDLYVKSPEDMVELKSQVNSLPELRELQIRLSTKAGGIQLGSPLQKEVSILWLYGVANDDCDWMLKLLTSLHIQKMYKGIIFMDSHLTPTGFARIAETLGKHSVKVEWVMGNIPREAWVDDHERQSGFTYKKLADFTRKHLKSSMVKLHKLQDEMLKELFGSHALMKLWKLA
ncbi:uncharacterized protein LOC143023676 [Oratosquilla oratoria]|uniref:uncharacterized protein LOC143023676 n=1 Tax=Oratosquilla oratoria TaxID=337810 RepID=UPI003F76B6ED